MEIQEQWQGAVAVLKPQGPLTQADVAAFQTRLTQVVSKCMGRILLDASAIPFVDSKGLESLVDATEEMATAGRALKLCGVNPTVRQILELTGWSDAFEYYQDVNSGIRSFL